MQVFQRHESELGGMAEAIALLREGAGRPGARRGLGAGLGQARVSALPEGAALEPWETVLTIEGDYTLFAHLETMYLGCLAVARASGPTSLARGGRGRQGGLFFSARDDHYLAQPSDGLAAIEAGAAAVTPTPRGRSSGRRGSGQSRTR